MDGHIRKSHNVSYLIYHLVCPAKYRRLVFVQINNVEKVIKETCQEIEKRYEIHFLEIGADRDHVHFLIQSVPIMNPSSIAKKVKSITAREVFHQVPEVKKLLWGGEFWTKGYYINTVGVSANKEAIQDYVKKQGQKYQRIYSNQLTLFEGY